MKKLHVKVEDYHIKTGTPRVNCACPISLAVTPLLPAGSKAIIGDDWWAIETGFSRKDGPFMLLPKVAVEFVEKFDKGKKVEPFEFDLEFVPDERPD